MTTEERNAKSRAYRAAHRQEFLAYNRKYKAAHPERVRASSKAYDYAHRDESRARRQANLEQKRSYNKAYRATNLEELLKKDRAYHATHREEIRAKGKIYRTINRDRVTARKKAFYAANSRTIIDKQKAFYAANPDRKRAVYDKNYRIHGAEIRAYVKDWRKRKKGLVNSYVMKRNAAKCQATPKWADHTAITAIYEHAARLTQETGIRYDVDHIYPLQSKTVCGLHVADNLQVLTHIENIKKRNKVPAHTTYNPSSIDFLCNAEPKLAAMP